MDSPSKALLVDSASASTVLQAASQSPLAEASSSPRTAAAGVEAPWEQLETAALGSGMIRLGPMQTAPAAKTAASASATQIHTRACVALPGSRCLAAIS